jgi:hypothetical protein
MNTYATIEELPFLCNDRVNMIRIDELLGNGIFCWGRPRLYNENPRPVENRIQGDFLRWQWKIIEKKLQERN